jgi:hypothetical protein
MDPEILNVADRPLLGTVVLTLQGPEKVDPELTIEIVPFTLPRKAERSGNDLPWAVKAKATSAKSTPRK